MKPFLLELAENVYRDYHRNLDALTLIFPNRRAALYFRKHLSSLLSKPAFAPNLLTIEDFIGGFSNVIVPDKLELIHRLYSVYQDVIRHSNDNEKIFQPESFDQFYFWGEMLLRDFDEADKYLVKAEHLFKDLSNQKELDAGFDFLTDEQREFLQNFWLSFDEKDSVNKSRFLHIWRQLYEVYNTFKKSLQQDGLAYEGMLHRDVAEQMQQYYTAGNKSFHVFQEQLNGKPAVLFIGFNALTGAEEKIISFFVSQGSGFMYWDIDAYYIHHSIQEAGKFLRDYQQHPVLGKTFPQDVPSNFKQLKHIDLYGAAQPIGQAKLLAELLAEKLATGINPEETLIVLPDEKLVMPVLHGISAKVDKLNVTMGFPLSNTPLFNLVELVIELQINRKEDCFNHKQVIALLGHPYVVAADAAAAQAKRKEILHQNWVLVPVNFLRTSVALHRLMFQPLDQAHVGSQSIQATITDYIRSLIIDAGRLSGLSALDKEYCFHFIKLLNQLESVIAHPADGIPVTVAAPAPDAKQRRKSEREALKSFLRLFRQLIRTEKIPFRGEPLNGLQVMGVLETRNLDFKNVFILSMNEGSFPSFSSKGSYIPVNLRKAYGLPTAEHQDSIYAYLFYRVLQRAENVVLFHNTETDDLGQGELSRYVQQLIFESGIPIRRTTLHNPLQPNEILSLSINKDERVFQGLANYCKGSKYDKSLSPSALNDYLECRLRFYFKYIARIKEADVVEEDLDARVLGNFLHNVMELFYHEIIEKKGNTTIEAGDFENYKTNIDALIDKAFIKHYSLDEQKKVVYEGQRLVVREMVKRFVDRIIELDKAYAPFTIEALERRDIKHNMPLEAEGKPVVVLGGSIDRADRKENIVRVIDYKTGKDQLSFPDVASLFSREKRRNKAAFQTFIYTLLYQKHIAQAGVKIIPGLMNRVNLFNDDFRFGLQYGGEFLLDAIPLLPEFEKSLRELLEEMYDPAVPFDQTPILENCNFCPYKRICYRA